MGRVSVPAGLEAALKRSLQMYRTWDTGLVARIPVCAGKTIEIDTMWTERRRYHFTFSIVHFGIGPSEFCLTHIWGRSEPVRAYSLPHMYCVPPAWTLSPADCQRAVAAPMIQAAARAFLSQRRLRRLRNDCTSFAALWTRELTGHTRRVQPDRKHTKATESTRKHTKATERH